MLTLHTMDSKLKDEIKTLRLKAGYTLRKFAEEVGISAAHLSDIEHGRRMPSDDVLQRMAEKLERVGASFQQLKSLDSRIEAELAEWAENNPAAGQMLRELRSSKKDPKKVLEELRRILGEDEKRKKKDSSE